MDTTELEPFRGWCNMVLPAVYDDSISYYELLCKVVEHLNSIGDATNISIDSLRELMELYGNVYHELQELTENLPDEVAAELNKYFDTHTFVREVNGKSNIVVLNASDVHARPDNWLPSRNDIISQLGYTPMQKRLLLYDGNAIKLDGVTQTYAMMYDYCMNKPDFVVLVYNDRAYHVNRVSSEQIVFITTYVSNGYVNVERISISSSNSITRTEGLAEMLANKTDIVNDKTNTSAKYVSGAALWKYLAANGDGSARWANKADANDLTTSGVYTVNVGTNLPTTASLHTLFVSSDIGIGLVTQICVPNNTDRIFYRRKVSDGAWSSWVELQSKLNFDSTPTSGSNNPVTSSGIATALADIRDNKTDIVNSSANTSEKYVSGAALWKYLAANGDGSARWANKADANDLTTSGVYTVNVGTNLPTTASLHTLFVSSDLGITLVTQICIPNNSDRIFYRRKVSNGAWSSWVELQSKLTFDSTPTAGSNNPVTSGGVASAMAAYKYNPGDTIEIGSIAAYYASAFGFLTSSNTECILTFPIHDINPAVTGVSLAGELAIRCNGIYLHSGNANALTITRFAITPFGLSLSLKKPDYSSFGGTNNTAISASCNLLRIEFI